MIKFRFHNESTEEFNRGDLERGLLRCREALPQGVTEIAAEQAGLKRTIEIEEE